MHENELSKIRDALDRLAEEREKRGERFPFVSPVEALIEAAENGDTYAGRVLVRGLADLIEALGGKFENLLPYLDEQSDRDPQARDLYETLRPFRGDTVERLARFYVPRLRKLGEGQETDAGKCLALKRSKSGSDPANTKERDWTIALEIGMRQELLGERLDALFEEIAEREALHFRSYSRRQEYPVEAVRAIYNKHKAEVDRRLDRDRILRESGFIPGHSERIAREIEDRA